MSALPPKADIGTRSRNVCFVPKADIRFHLVDYIVGAGEQCRRHNETQGLSRLEIDDEIEFRWLQDRKISRLLALQDTGDIPANLVVRVGDARSITDQTTFDGIFTELIDCR